VLQRLPDKIFIHPRWIPPGYDEIRHHHFKAVYSRGELEILKKKKPMPVSAWAERHRVVPEDSSIPGRWKNSTTPYLAGIMDASFFPSVQEIIICAPPQTGKSDCVNNCIGYAADRKPGNVLYVYPDELTAKENAKDRLRPMFNDSTRLRSYLTGYQDDMASLKINLRHMKIYMAWANSAARLGNKPLPYVVLDEEDKYPPTAGKKEASPADLAKKRTRTFPHMRKVWRMSTPTMESGPIWMALTKEAEVIFVYWVRCPDCEGLQQMVFEQIKWPGGGDADPREVETRKLSHYECEKCGAHWDDLSRNIAVRHGEWREKKTGLALNTWLKSHKPRSIGFHLKSWISPFVSMSEAAAAFLWGMKDKTKLKDFQNGHAAEPWKVYTKDREEDRILALQDDRPRGMVPGGGVVAALTAGVDTQDNGFYYEIRAWGFGMEKESWCVREGFCMTWDALKQILWDDEYKDADGNTYFVRIAFQDALGHRTAEVYDFCRQHRGRIVPTFGKKTMAQPHAWSNIEYYPGTKKPIPGGLKALNVNTLYYKNELSRLLEINPADPGAFHYHSELSYDWAAMMTVEYLDEKGFWACPDGKANHGWDCSVLALAAHEVLGVKFWKRPGAKTADPTIKKNDGKETLGEKLKQFNRPSWLNR